MKKFTTSAQKTLTLPKEAVLKKLEEEMSKDPELIFEKTKLDNIRKAKLKNGSVMIIASFEKDKGKTLAMIDYKDLPATFERKEIQKQLRNRLDDIF